MGGGGGETHSLPDVDSAFSKTGTLSSRLAILHALCHIESWAIDLVSYSFFLTFSPFASRGFSRSRATKTQKKKTHSPLFRLPPPLPKKKSWDIVARFGRDPTVSAHLPRAFFDDFVRVADDEGKHFLALRDRLEALGSRYGAFEAHDTLWHSAVETAHSLPARLAVEHAVHEARGLDVMPMTLQKMRLDPESQALLRVRAFFFSFSLLSVFLRIRLSFRFEEGKKKSFFFLYIIDSLTSLSFFPFAVDHSSKQKKTKKRT